MLDVRPGEGRTGTRICASGLMRVCQSSRHPGLFGGGSRGSAHDKAHPGELSSLVQAPHLTDGENEAQGGQVTSPGTHSRPCSGTQGLRLLWGGGAGVGEGRGEGLPREGGMSLGAFGVSVPRGQ